MKKVCLSVVLKRKKEKPDTAIPCLILRCLRCGKKILCTDPIDPELWNDRLCQECRPPRIRTICSWCGAVIVDVPVAADNLVSHGICPDCLAKEAGQL